MFITLTCSVLSQSSSSDTHLRKRVETFAFPIYIPNNEISYRLKKSVLHMEFINKKRKTELSCDNGLHQSRFKTTLSILHLAGIPRNVTSNVYTFCYTVGAVCLYTTFICVLMDTYVHRNDLMQNMEIIRFVFAFLLCVWIQLSLR